MQARLRLSWQPPEHGPVRATEPRRNEALIQANCTTVDRVTPTATRSTRYERVQRHTRPLYLLEPRSVQQFWGRARSLWSVCHLTASRAARSPDGLQRSAGTRYLLRPASSWYARQSAP